MNIQDLVDAGIARALIIRQPYIGQILDGRKTWELRSSKTKVRGRIALIEGGSGLITGTVDIWRVMKAPTTRMARNFTRCYHGLEWHELYLMDKWRYVWELSGAKHYATPIPYKHPKGAAIWVNLEKLVKAV